MRAIGTDRSRVFSSLLVSLIALAGACWQDANPQVLSGLKLDGYVYAAAVSPDGRDIAVNTLRSVQRADGSWDNEESVEVFQPALSKLVSNVSLESAGLVKDAPLTTGGSFVGYCDDGKYLVVYDKNGALYVLNTDSYRVDVKVDLGLGALPLHGPRGGSTKVDIACSAHGNAVVAAVHGGEFSAGLIKVFALPSGQLTAQFVREPSQEQIRTISISPNGAQLALLLQSAQRPPRSNGEPNVEIFETRGLALVHRFSTGDAAQSLIFAGESELATDQAVSEGKSVGTRTVRVWNIDSGAELKRLSDAKRDIQGPLSASANGEMVLGYIPELHACALCNGLEGRTDVKEQRFAVWDKATGAEVFRSDPFGPILRPFQPQCVLSQGGKYVLVYWPSTEITPRVIATQQ
jgi:hypothetical protein